MNKTGYILVVQPGCYCSVLFQHLNHCLDFGTCIGPCRTLRTLFLVLAVGDFIILPLLERFDPQIFKVIIGLISTQVNVAETP